MPDHPSLPPHGHPASCLTWAAVAFTLGVIIATLRQRPDLGTPTAWTRGGRHGVVHTIRGVDGGLIELRHGGAGQPMCPICRPED